MTVKAHAFDVGDYVVYPKHGVGRVIELLEQEIAGMKLELYVLRFEKERMTPVSYTHLDVYKRQSLAPASWNRW